MEKKEDVDAMAERTCTKRARLHRSFLHLSKSLKKLHPRRAHHQANASGEPPPPTPSSSAASSFLSGCMHPRTHSFASGRRHCHDDDALLAVDFRSLRIGPAADAGAGDEGSSSSPHDIYFSDGGEERQGMAPPPAPTTTNEAVDGVAVETFSAAPYEDFRRSMREMVDDAAGRPSGAPAVDWEFMEELLFCYLRLNDRAVHRDILRAFTDTVAALRRRRRRRRAAAAKSIGRTRRRGAGGEDSSGDDGDEDAAVRRPADLSRRRP